MGDLDQSGSSRIGGKESDSEYVLKVGPTRFTDGLVVKCKREEARMIPNFGPVHLVEWRYHLLEMGLNVTTLGVGVCNLQFQDTSQNEILLYSLLLKLFLKIFNPLSMNVEFIFLSESHCLELMFLHGDVVLQGNDSLKNTTVT